MGCHENIGSDKFPKQGKDLHTRAKVLFHFIGPEIGATIVRDDQEEPFRTILRLDDGRYVLATECQYQPESLSL